MPDCGDNSCMYAVKRGGMRTNGGCRCDACPKCGRHIRAERPHQGWCPQPEWVPEHHRQPAAVVDDTITCIERGDHIGAAGGAR